MELGGFIRKERAKQKLSMRALSRKSGITLSYLSNIENNKLEHSPNIEMVFDLLQALNVDEPHKKMAELGLVENEDIPKEENYSTIKRERYKKEIDMMMDGMNVSEMESLFLLLKEHFTIIELLSETRDKKDTLDQFETYVEFMQFKEVKKNGLNATINP